MKRELTGMSHFYNPSTASMFSGKISMIINGGATLSVEVHVRHEQTGETTTLVYANPAQIEVLTSLVGAVEDMHTALAMPVAVG